MPCLVLIIHCFSMSSNREVQIFIAVFAKELENKVSQSKKKKMLVSFSGKRLFLLDKLMIYTNISQPSKKNFPPGHLICYIE